MIAKAAFQVYLNARLDTTFLYLIFATYGGGQTKAYYSELWC